MIATAEPSQHPASAPAVALPASDLVTLPAPDFHLQATLECGQVFHWVRQGAGYAGVIDRTPVYVEQRGETLLATRGAEEAVRRYFALDHPLAEIYATFPGDEAMRGAVEFARGLRVIRQPLWECLATFLTSSMKQVAHIAQMSHAIRRKYGRAVAPGFYAYPTPAELARATEEELRACSLGYRAKNLLATARMVAEGELDLEARARAGTRGGARRALPRAGRRREGRELRAAFRLRAPRRVPDRCLDRARAARAFFQRAAARDDRAPAGVFARILRPVRRLRAAVSVSSRAQNVAAPAQKEPGGSRSMISTPRRHRTRPGAARGVGATSRHETRGRVKPAPMIIDAALNPAEIARLSSADLTDTTCVVFDVLRATSSMITALAHGAEAIHPVCTIEEAFLAKERLPDAVLGGERHGDPIAGFDAGNSPFEYRAFPGRTIVSTTTNGTIALRACDGARAVLVGAILNLQAVAEHIRSAPRRRAFCSSARAPSTASRSRMRGPPGASSISSAEASAPMPRPPCSR